MVAFQILERIYRSADTVSLTWLAVIVLCWACLCSALRFRRLTQSKKQWHPDNNSSTTATAQPLKSMTACQAQKIVRDLNSLEFPSTYERGLQLALFRTYGVSTISKLLAQTTQLVRPELVGKRYADTTVLISDIFDYQPTDPRSHEAFARLNFLHGNYIKAGRISNDDMLYTLSVFASVPVELINKFEWRGLEDFELCAIGLHNLTMGQAMDIKFDGLPSFEKGWKNGKHYLEEVSAWAEEYEQKCMVADKVNYDVAIRTQDLVLEPIPAFFRPLLVDIISASMDDRLRDAIQFERPSLLAPILLQALYGIRKLFLRYLSLPRPTFNRVQQITSRPDSSGKRYLKWSDAQPHYIKPTLWNRYGPGSWLSRWVGRPLPGDADMCGEGFAVKEIGPKAFRGKGSKEFDETYERLSRERTGGCPFKIAR